MTEFEHLQGTEFEEQANKVAEIKGKFSHTVGYKTNVDKMHIIFTALNDAYGQMKQKDDRIAEKDIRIARLELLLGLSRDWLDDVCNPDSVFASKEGLAFRATIETVLEDTNDRA